MTWGHVRDLMIEAAVSNTKLAFGDYMDAPFSVKTSLLMEWTYEPGIA
jgi:hypothetical protein